MFSLLLNSCSTTKTIYVADSFANCKGGESEKCIQVKEAQEDDWTLLNNTIEGFDYKEGSIYKIEVKTTKIKNSSSDGTTLKYKLVKVIYKEKSEMPEEKLSFNGNWKVSSLIGLDNLSKSPTLNIDHIKKQISGNAGCNSYGVDFSIEGNQIKFGIPVATKMMCSNMKVEKTFFNCLQNTSQYKLVDGKLKLYSKDGEEQMICTKVE